MVKLTKKKRMEKAKVKLKAKKLPKGQNVTNTSFKIKKIVIPSQLHETSDSDIYTKKKLNVQELLSHLKHHNVTMRSEGVSGLKELISVYEDDVIKLHLPRVIDGVASLVLDIESDVRKSALKLLEIIFSKVSTEQINPHFNILQTYMSCAMTHINMSIREDSLLLLDSLLNACPLLMVKKADDVLPTFLNMVSNTKNDVSRTLSMSVNNRVTSVQWRMKVFQRLTKYFSAIVAAKKHGNESSQSMELDSAKESNLNVVAWTDNSPLFAADFMSFRKEICNLPRVFSYVKLSSESVGQNTADQQKTLKEHIRSLLPVLFEAWVEIAPERNSAEVNILSEEGAIMLQYVVETLQHIWDCLKSWEEESGINNLTSWFSKHYRKTIISAFLPGFPFSLQENVFKLKRKSLPLHQQEKSLFGNMNSLSPKCTQQNLSLCYLFACLHDEKDRATIKSVMDYLKSCILEWKDMELLPVLKKVLSALMIDERSSWSRAVVLRAAVIKCQDRSVPKELYEVLFSLLCDFVVLSGCNKELSHQNFEKWIFELSCVLFGEEVPMKTVKALTSLANQNQKIFMDGLKKRSRSIINSLCEISVTGYSSPIEGQKIILNMLFHVVGSQSFDSLLKRLYDSEEHQELVSYVQNLKALSEFLEL